MSENVVIVGAGEIGSRFARAAEHAGIGVQIVTRDHNLRLLDGPAGVPLLVCVREGDLPDVLAKVPPSRSRDLIVVQNGFVDELLTPYPDATRGVIWFTSKGTFFADVLQSPVYGPRADLLRKLINAVGASAETITDQDVFRRYLLEKAVWSCVVGAPLAVWGVDLATARHERMSDVEQIVDEACNVVRVALGVDISSKRVLATLDDTSKTLGWMRGGTKAAYWRNGKIVEWGERCGIPTPANRAVIDSVVGSGKRVTEID